MSSNVIYGGREMLARIVTEPGPCHYRENLARHRADADAAIRIIIHLVAASVACGRLSVAEFWNESLARMRVIQQQFAAAPEECPNPGCKAHGKNPLSACENPDDGP